MTRITTKAIIRHCNLNDGFSVNHSELQVTKLPNGTITASIEHWHYAVAVDTHRLIGELIKEQRATRKVMERIDRRLAKRVKL